MKVLLGLAAIFPAIVFATPYQYVIFNYDIAAAGNTLSTAQCQKVLQTPLYYNIVDKKITYKPNTFYQATNYKRLLVTYLGQYDTLIHGSLDYTITLPGKKAIHEKTYTQFIYDRNKEMIQGSIIIPNLCTANIIGLKQQLNTWPRKKS
jgi:hypothetical protein